MDSQALVDAAIQFAKTWHGHVNHQRKYTGEPYTVHLAAVAELVSAHQGTPEMIAAAWLHDVVEDTPVTMEDIRAQFGDTVTNLVEELTDVSGPEDGNRALRKAMDKEHLAKASDSAKTIKLADLIDNAESIIEHDPTFANVYIKEMRALLEVLEGGNEQLYRRANEIVEKYQSTRGA